MSASGVRRVSRTMRRQIADCRVRRGLSCGNGMSGSLVSGSPLQHAEGGDRESVERRGLRECGLTPVCGELSSGGAADRDRRCKVEQQREILLAEDARELRHGGGAGKG